MKFNRAEISNIINEFYERAQRDVIIGYHFQRIDDFDSHIERIETFWLAQFGLEQTNLQFNIKLAHEHLGIKYGEVGRWVVLFKDVLQENGNQDLTDVWLQKINLIANAMTQHFFAKPFNKL